MMKLTFASASLTVLLLGGMVDTASAQGFGISFENHKNGKHFSFNLGFEGDRRYRGARPFPAPVHVHCDSCRRWIPGGCEVVTERIWIAGRLERVWVPATYREPRRVSSRHGRHGWHGGYGRVMVRPGYWQTIEHPGHYEFVQRTIERPGHWEIVCGY